MDEKISRFPKKLQYKQGVNLATSFINKKSLYQKVERGQSIKKLSQNSPENAQLLYAFENLPFENLLSYLVLNGHCSEIIHIGSNISEDLETVISSLSLNIIKKLIYEFVNNTELYFGIDIINAVLKRYFSLKKIGEEEAKKFKLKLALNWYLNHKIYLPFDTLYDDALEAANTLFGDIDITESLTLEENKNKYLETYIGFIKYHLTNCSTILTRINHEIAYPEEFQVGALDLSFCIYNFVGDKDLLCARLGIVKRQNGVYELCNELIPKNGHGLEIAYQLITHPAESNKPKPLKLLSNLTNYLKEEALEDLQLTRFILEIIAGKQSVLSFDQDSVSGFFAFINQNKSKLNGVFAKFRDLLISIAFQLDSNRAYGLFKDTLTANKSYIVKTANEITGSLEGTQTTSTDIFIASLRQMLKTNFITNSLLAAKILYFKLPEDIDFALKIIKIEPKLLNSVLVLVSQYIIINPHFDYKKDENIQILIDALKNGISHVDLFSLYFNLNVADRITMVKQFSIIKTGILQKNFTRKDVLKKLEITKKIINNHETVSWLLVNYAFGVNEEGNYISRSKPSDLQITSTTIATTPTLTISPNSSSSHLLKFGKVELKEGSEIDNILLEGLQQLVTNLSKINGLNLVTAIEGGLGGGTNFLKITNSGEVEHLYKQFNFWLETLVELPTIARGKK